MEYETYYITEEQMARVNTYLPLKAKSDWVSLVAEKCFDVLNVNASYEDEDFPMPPMYKENTAVKSRYMMGALVRLYLRGDWERAEDEDEWLMPIDEYDKWAGGHIFSQINRFKANTELRDTCYNLLDDYKDLERRLNVEIHGLMSVMNDPVTRQLAAQQISMTPEYMEKAIEGLNSAKDALMEYQEERTKAEENAQQAGEVKAKDSEG